MDWPLYFKDRLIIDNLESNVGVITLWMPKESVASVLSPGSFSVCGQLYTKRGISPLLRNVLANPKIRYLVICGVDRQGSGEALLKFFEHGVEQQVSNAGEVRGWKIIQDDEALIDKEISIDALNIVRNNVTVFDLRMKPLDVIAQKVDSLLPLESTTEAQLFDEPEPLSINQYPSDMSVFKIRRDYIGESWLDVLKTLNRFGSTVPGMYGSVKEVHNLCVVIEKEDPDKPKLEEFYNFKMDGLSKYLEGFFQKDKGSESYTYGERLFSWDDIDQIELMKEKLKRYPVDRGALAVLWKPHVDNFPPKDTEVKVEGQTKGWRVPCLVMLLGQCINDSFNMTAVFRNNDMFGAWPLNAYALRKLQKEIAVYIEKDLGSLTTISHIAEIYEMDWDSATRVVEDNDSLARTCMWDSRGYYIVGIEGENIVLTFMSPDGSNELGKYTANGKGPKVARDLCAQGIKDMLISDLGAACDLGRQLAKAEAAIKLGLNFEQDQPLKFK